MLTYVLATEGFKHDIVKQVKPKKIIIALKLHVSLNYDEQFNKGR